MTEVLEIRKRAHEYVQNGELDRALAEYGKLLGRDADTAHSFGKMAALPI